MAPDPGATHGAALATLEHHFQAMPPVAALRIRVDGFDGDCLRLSAPLAVHVNDKGCAFGGSLGSLMTLAAWGVVTLRLQAAGIAADVFVADSDVRFLAPLFADLHAEARLADPGEWDGFIARLRERGRAVGELRRVNEGVREERAGRPRVVVAGVEHHALAAAQLEDGLARLGERRAGAGLDAQRAGQLEVADRRALAAPLQAQRDVEDRPAARAAPPAWPAAAGGSTCAGALSAASSAAATRLRPSTPASTRPSRGTG